MSRNKENKAYHRRVAAEEKAQRETDGQHPDHEEFSKTASRLTGDLLEFFIGWERGNVMAWPLHSKLMLWDVVLFEATKVAFLPPDLDPKPNAAAVLEYQAFIRSVADEYREICLALLHWAPGKKRRSDHVESWSQSAKPSA